MQSAAAAAAPAGLKMNSQQRVFTKEGAPPLKDAEGREMPAEEL